MFEIKNVSKKYKGEYALRDISMNIGKGLNFIIGASGSGKTTLLKIISGMENDFEGEVFYCGQSVKTLTEKQKSYIYNNTFGFVWQDFNLREELSVLENVMLPQYLKESCDEKAAMKVLHELKISELAKQKAGSLSGGQKQRVAVARELLKDPKVIIADEPTSALDAKSAKIIMDILRDISKKRTVIVVTHDTSLIDPKAKVYELDKGELVSASEAEAKTASLKYDRKHSLAFTNVLKLGAQNIKSGLGRFAVSAAAVFKELYDKYGPTILNIDIIGSFMSAAGGNDDGPNADVTQDINGLYEKYETDERVEYIVSMQAFENIKIAVDGKTYAVEKTGSSPVLNELLSGSIPAGEEYQVVIPLKFAESLGLTPESAIGKKLDFSATIFQWIDNQPIEKPVHIEAVVCGVADNTVVYDYEGKTYSYTVDDSFFFNRAAITELRRQAGVSDKSSNFTIHAKTPEDLIALKDELNRNGIVPLGRFELVEDLVRLNSQTKQQSGSAVVLIAALALLAAAAVSVMTAVMRKREYAIYKVSGYTPGHIAFLSAGEYLIISAFSAVFFICASPLINIFTKVFWNVGILNIRMLGAGAVLTFAVGALSLAVTAVIGAKTDAVNSLKTGDR